MMDELKKNSVLKRFKEVIKVSLEYSELITNGSLKLNIFLTSLIKGFVGLELISLGRCIRLLFNSKYCL